MESANGRESAVDHRFASTALLKLEDLKVRNSEEERGDLT